MLSTFAPLHLLTPPREPRSRLVPGVTAFYSSCRPRRRPLSAPANSQPRQDAAPIPEIPASVAAFALETLEFPADLAQQDILSTTNHRVIVCCCRQWGKSTMGAIKALHHALSNPGSLTLLASRTGRQSGELLEKVTTFLKTLDLPVRRAHRHSSSLLLPNGSRIIALPGNPDALRGFSAVSLLIVDEAAYVPDELYNALRPMLATTNGSVWLLSTPRNRTGFFYDEWAAETSGWSKYCVTADNCPRISAEFLEEERLRHGPAIFLREYHCDFSCTGASFFEFDALDDASDPDRYLAAQNFSFGRAATRIIIGFDLGQKLSHSAIVAIEVFTGATNRRDPVTFKWIEETRLVFRRIERLPLNVPYDSLISRLHRAIRDLGDPKITTLVVDATGCGQPFVELLRKEKTGALIAPIGITSGGGVSFSSSIQRVPKKDLMASANYLLTNESLAAEPGLAGLKELREEMEAVRVRTARNGSDTFRSAAKDDLVMAFALVAWRARTYLPRRPASS